MDAPGVRAWILPVLACAVVGVLAGTAVGLTGSSDESTTTAPSTLVESDDSAEVVPVAVLRYYRCPGEGPLSDFHANDRVFATARDESGDWLAVREPVALDSTVWVPIEGVEPDQSFADLPAEPCRWEPPLFEDLPESPESEPDPDGPGTEPDPDEPEPNGPGPGPIPPGPGPDPTGPPDTSPPDLQVVVAEPADIWEVGCINPRSVVRAVVRDDEGVDRVELSWSVGAARGSTTMRAEVGEWVAELGDFQPRTVDPAGPGSEPVVLTVEAVDRAGNTTVETTSDVLRLHLCD